MENEQFTINVRSIISMYENRTLTSQTTACPEMKRAKSLGNLMRKTSIYQQFLGRNLEQIQLELNHLNDDLNNYRVYRRNDHIFYQNRLLQILIELINLDNDSITDRKHELIDLIKDLHKSLNLLLPEDNGNLRKIIKLQAVPFQYPDGAVSNGVNDNDNDDSVNGSSELMPSFQKLKSLFERKSAKNGGGLQMITMEEKHPKVVTPLGHRYVSYQELSVNN